MTQTVLSTHNLVKRIGTRTLMDRITLSLEAGSRLSLPGNNGTGKSALFRLLAGSIAPDGRSVSRRGDLHVALI
jgi:ATP-binding cassette subfamily F protein uup